MHTRKATTLVFTLIASVLFLGSAYANTSALPLLYGYNIPNSLLGAATFINITYSGTVYTLVNVSGTPYFLVNTTGAGSFVLDANTVADIIGPSILSASSSKINFSTVSYDMSEYINSSASSINDCVVETGISTSTCTLANGCSSCTAVPVCNKVLVQTGGPTEPFGEGVIIFEQQYIQLESNISLFNAYAGGSAGANLSVRAQKISAAVANISKLTQSIGHNPLFPPPASADFASCSPAGSITFNLSSESGSWYCNAVGYCGFTTYNSTMLSKIQVLVNSINSQLPSQSAVSAMAGKIVAYENTYITPAIAARQHSLLESAINTSLSGFNVTINSSNALLTHINNATLAAAVAAVRSNYSNLVNNYSQLNITRYVQGISSSLGSIKQLYEKLNSTYSAALSEAKNNTAVLIALQLNGDKSNKTAALSFDEQQLNQKLEGQVSNITEIKANLGAIAAQLPALGSSIDLSPEALSRAIDGPFATYLAGALGMSYKSAVGAVPAFSALLSLIIGLILVAILFIMYERLNHRHRLRHDRRASHAWRMLFVVAIVLVLIYVLITYAVASAANATAPESAFNNALTASHSIVIAINGTVTQALSNCAVQVSEYAHQRNYTANTIYLSGAECAGSGSIMNASQCLNQYARLNVPVMLLTQSNGSEISIYSMYGTVMSVIGNQQFINSCYASFFVR